MAGKKSPDSLTSEIRSLTEIVYNNLEKEDFDVAEFAAQAGVSRSELYRRLKKLTGKSVTEFIRDIRLEESLKLLQNTDWTASEVGYKVGFNSPTYFSKCFKEKFGITPGEADSGLTPVRGSLYDDNLKNTKPQPARFWSPGRLWLLFILIFASGFGYWYYLAVPEEKKHAEEIVAKMNSIAMMPIINRTGDSAYNGICYGISKEINSKISNTKSIQRVIPLSSVEPYRDQGLTPIEIGSTFNVEYIINAELLGSEGQLKIWVQFIDVQQNHQLWAKDFSFNLTENTKEIFKIQEQIADNVLAKMGLSKTDANGIPTTTESTEAYKNYLQGLHKKSVSTEKSWNFAIDFFNKAIKEDPNYIDAYLELGLLWGYAGMNWAYVPQEVAWNNRKKYLRKVLELDPENKDALLALREGYFYFELNAANTIPELPEATLEEMLEYSSDFATKTGRHQRGLKRNRQWELKSPTGGVYPLLAINYFFLGEMEQARQLLDGNFEVYKDNLNFLRELAKAYYLLGDYKNMEKAVNLFYDTFEARPSILIWMRAIVAAYNNDPLLEEEQVTILRNNYKEGASGSPAWFLALYYAHKQDYGAALDWLERSYEAREVEMTWLAQEPVLAPLGNAPRYRALLDNMQFPDIARRHITP